MTERAGRVRAARLTDLAALGELSRLSQGEGTGTRSLGLPVTGPAIGVFSLFRMPLGAFGPHDLLYVYDEAGRIAGLLRVERDGIRDEWTIVELDAVGVAAAGDIRHRLVQALLREGARRGAMRIHVACLDAAGNVELFMQSGFVRYGEERIMVRPAGTPLPKAWAPAAAEAARIRPVVALDALPLSRLYAAVTPAPVQRLEAYRLGDWERHPQTSRMPRSSLAPILRFADVEAFVLETAGGGPDGTGLDAFLQVGVAKEDQPHYVKVLARAGVDVAPLVGFGLGVIGARSGGSHRHDHGVLTPVRTYEGGIEPGLASAGFESVATVTLLMKETVVRVAEPALVPAVR